MSTTKTGSRSEARSIIEELWAEREQGHTVLTPLVRSSAPAPAPAERRPPAGRRERMLATAIVVLLAGNGLAFGAKAIGLVGGASKATFVAKADAVCGPANAQLSALSPPRGYAAVATTAATFVTTAGAQVRSLGSLQLPDLGDRAEARGALAAMSATVDAGRRLQSGAAAGDPAVTAAATRTMALYAQDATTKAKAFGLSTCAVGMQPSVDALLAGADGAVKGSAIERVGIICTKLVHDAEALPVPKTMSELNWFIDRSSVLYNTFVTELKAVPVPRGDEPMIAELASGMVELGNKTREMGGAAMNGDMKRVRAIEKEGNALADALDAKFSAYGFTHCGS
ncbi:MAG TPA: hypothetical protein VMZ73_08455 [Acidimicrobiales bacterium]|nr:hypothetical protein [Acidimicrobiales bacterium]